MAKPKRKRTTKSAMIVNSMVMLPGTMMQRTSNMNMVSITPSASLRRSSFTWVRSTPTKLLKVFHQNKRPGIVPRRFLLIQIISTVSTAFRQDYTPAAARVMTFCILFHYRATVFASYSCPCCIAVTYPFSFIIRPHVFSPVHHFKRLQRSYS